MAVRVAILDDYQNVALKLADWSKLGKDVEIVKCGSMPKAYRFMVGDASRIEVP